MVNLISLILLSTVQLNASKVNVLSETDLVDEFQVEPGGSILIELTGARLSPSDPRFAIHHGIFWSQINERS